MNSKLLSSRLFCYPHPSRCRSLILQTRHNPCLTKGSKNSAKTFAKSTDRAGFGPQSPRNIDTLQGANNRMFSMAPAFTEMNLCNIHFHKNAEHNGGEFSKPAGNGDGKGFGTGFLYSGTLTDAEFAPVDAKIGKTKHGYLQPGDTIEVHYVHTTAKVTPGPILGACLSEAIGNTQLRAETQVYVLVNDDKALDFVELTKHAMVDGVHQAINIPTNTAAPVQYEGSTTGPSYNEVGSPFQVSWSVRSKVPRRTSRPSARDLKTIPSMKVTRMACVIWSYANAFCDRLALCYEKPSGKCGAE